MKISKVSIITALIGLGLVCFVWHIRLPEHLMRYFFIPWIGMGMLVIGVVTTLTHKNYKLDLGKKRIWIPLAIISISIIFSGILAFLEKRLSGNESLSIILMGLFLFCLYLASRVWGERIFRFMPYVVAIEAISIITYGAFNDWRPNGGLISWSNYDIATGLLIFGVLVSPVRHQWWLTAVATVGLVFSGSGEAIFCLAVLFIAILIRRDWSKKLLVPAGALLVTLALIIPTGVIYKCQAPVLDRLKLARAETNGQSSYEIIKNSGWLRTGEYSSTVGTESAWDRILGFRFSHFQLSPIKPFGYGLNLFRFYWGIPHNVILIIIEQVGILAMLSWLYIALRQTKVKGWQYAWIGFISLGVLDHFIWTQSAPWFWALLGVSSMTNRSSMIFKEI